METLADRIARLRKARGYSQQSLAAALGLSGHQAVQSWESGKTAPTRKRQQKLAMLLGVSAQALMFGEQHTELSLPGNGAAFINTTEYESNVTAGPLIATVAPVITWTEACMLDAVLADPGDREYIPTTRTGTVYALRVEGDSMAPKFPPGALLLVDANEPAMPGRYVIARKAGAKAAVFKELVEDGGVRYLKPINPAYPMIALEAGDQIIGVVKRVGIDV